LIGRIPVGNARGKEGAKTTIHDELRVGSQASHAPNVSARLEAHYGLPMAGNATEGRKR